MLALFDELPTAGEPIGEDELISFIVAGLDMEYQPIISALDVRTEPITVDALFSMVANFDQWVELFHGSGAGGFKSSANLAARNHGGGGKGNNRGSSKPTNGGGGYRGGGSNSNGGGGNANNN